MCVAGAQLLDTRWRCDAGHGGGGVSREPECRGPGVVDAVTEDAKNISEALDDDAVVKLERRVDGVSIGGGEGE